MKINISVALLAITFLTASKVSAESAKGEVRLQYNWQPGSVYTYACEVVPRIASEPEQIKCFYEVITQEKNTALIAVRSPRYSDKILFVYVTDKGQIAGAQRVGGWVTPPEASFTNQTSTSALRDLHTLSFFSEEQFSFPASSLGNASPVIFNGCRFQVLAGEGDTNDVVKIRVSRVGKPSEEDQLRRFDLARGVLIETARQYRENSTLFMRLKDIQLMNAKEMETRKAQLSSALNEDDFRLKLCRQLLNDTNRMTKKWGYSFIMAIKDPALLGTAYSELVKAAGNDSHFQALNDTFFIPRLLKGERWAVEAFNKEQWSGTQSDSYLHRIASLQALSGLNLGSDHAKWCAWFRRVQGVLPKLQETDNDDLLQKLTHDDPWVRLFSIVNLTARKGVADVKPSLEKAALDTDEQVRAFASERLKSLEGKVPEANSP